jgi:hypothetical protein
VAPPAQKFVDERPLLVAFGFLAISSVGKVFPHLEARVCIERGIPHSKDSLSLLMVQYSNDTYALKKSRPATLK